jgi:outer membrane protein assembly factor BamB
VRDKRVFTLGQHGHALCCDAQTGDKIWSRQLPARYNPDVDYGFAWSPLLVRDHLVFCAGRRGLALRARDGAMAWGDDGVAGSCASAVPFGSQPGAGVALVVNNQRESVSLVGVHPITGEVQWRSGEWPEKWGAACIDPLVVGNRVLLTTAEQFPQAARFTIEGGKVSQDWVNAGFACYTGGCVFIKDCVFGVTRDGILKCIDWETGRMHWGQRGFDRHGALMAADGMLIIQASSSGELVVARAEAGGYEELRRYQVFPQESSSFTVPVLANGQLFCRSYAGELVCLNLAPGAAE